MMTSLYLRLRVGAPLSNCLATLLPAPADPAPMADLRVAKPRSRTVALSEDSVLQRALPGPGPAKVALQAYSRTELERPEALQSQSAASILPSFPAVASIYYKQIVMYANFAIPSE
jgi:hypothetical protein